MKESTLGTWKLTEGTWMLTEGAARRNLGGNNRIVVYKKVGVRRKGISVRTM